MRIEGLSWQENWSIPNGGESSIHPIPSVQPATIVYHGEERFNYGHYGIHLGQEDILTFLGPNDQVIVGKFIDCREGSPTQGVAETFSWTPSSRKRLRIPAGVAHAFDNLERVFTINSYKSYLPNLSDWLNGQTDWSPSSDVINVPENVDPKEVPVFRPNSAPASDTWYAFFSAVQNEVLKNVTREYPMTMDIQMDSGEKVRMKLSKRIEIEAIQSEFPCGIDGVEWRPHLNVPSGKDSGFIPLVDQRPMYFIDHGSTAYSHDAYGIHCFQEDRLTFLGSSSQVIRVKMFDSRQGSPTLGLRCEFDFSPSPLRYLCIPAGVAHAFEGLENVFTVNRPRLLKVPGSDSGFRFPDVVDWPLDREPLPSFETGIEEIEPFEYRRRVALQKEQLTMPVDYETPAVLLFDQGNGNHIRVALRRKSLNANAQD